MSDPEPTTAPELDDLVTEAGLIAYGNSLCELLRKWFTEGQTVPTGAAIVMTRGEDGEPLDPPGVAYVYDGGAEKNFLSLTMRLKAEEYGATAIFFFSETWTVDFESDAERAAWRGRDWGKHPRAEELVYCSFEHLEFAERAWDAPITRDASGEGTLGEFKCRVGGRSSGRFTSFLRHAKRNVSAT